MMSMSLCLAKERGNYRRIRECGYCSGACFFNDLSCSFDGVDEYVNVSDAGNFERTDKFSVSAWIKTTSGNEMVVSKNDDISGWQFYIVSSGQVYVSLDSNKTGGNRITRQGTTAVNTGSWFHVCFTYDGSSQNTGIKIYVNGVEEGAGGINNLSASILAAANCFIGARADFQAYFNGNIDDVSIWNKELAQYGVDEIYNSGKPACLLTCHASSYLTSYWRMGDGSIWPVIADHKGVNNGTMVNMSSGNFVLDVP